MTDRKSFTCSLCRDTGVSDPSALFSYMELEGEKIEIRGSADRGYCECQLGHQKKWKHQMEDRWVRTQIK